MAKIIEPVCVVDWDAIDDAIDDSYNYGIWNEDCRHNLTKYHRVETPYCESEFRNGVSQGFQEAFDSLYPPMYVKLLLE